MVSFLKNKKFLIMLVCIILIVFGSLIMYNNVSSTIHNAKEVAVEERTDQEFEYIYTYLSQTILNASISANEVSSNIENDLLSTFNLTDLKNALDGGNLNYKVKVHEIYRKYTENNNLNGVDNHRNGYIILSGDLVVEEDFVIDIAKYKEPSTSINNQLHKHRFSDYRELSYNKELFDDAIWKLKNHSDSIIAIEPYNCLDDSHIKLTELAYESLKDLYSKEGLEGLKNYQFLIPVYITDTGDIFGQKDIVEGVPQDTYKIIVIQSFNLYDQIIHDSPNLEVKNEKDRATLIQRYDNILYDLNLFGIIIMVSMSILVIFFFSLYNEHIENDQDEDSDITT